MGRVDRFSDADQLISFSNAVDFTWLILSGAAVFYMQAGFAMLEAGSVRVKNTKALMLKCVLDNCVSMVAFYIVGWAIGFGVPGDPDKGYRVNKITGRHGWALDEQENYALFFYQWTFAASAATIVSGAIAERVRLSAYLIHVTVLSAVIYPFLAHWAWGDGWLARYKSNGYLDFAGTGVVHLTGGICALCGAIILGPRHGRFDKDGRPVPIPGFSTTLIALGSFLLWYGWYGFNMGSTITFVGREKIAGRVAVNTTLAGASSGLITVLLSYICYKTYDAAWLLNGLLSGFVTITGSGAYIDFWAAIVVGACSAVWYSFLSWLLLKCRVDDPVDATPIHAGCGFLGVIMTGLFSEKDLIEDALARPTDAYGLFLGGGWEQLEVQCVGAATIIAWSGGISIIVFGLLWLVKFLRIPKEEEMRSVDSKSTYVDAWARVQIMDSGRLEEFQFKLDKGKR